MLCLILSAVLMQGAAQLGGPPAPLRGQEAVLVAEEVFQATFVSIEDGDTLTVRALASGEASVIHVAGVDAPEPSQPGGAEATAFLANLVSGKTMTVRLKGALDRFAQIEVDGADVSLLVIRNGMAWHCPRFANEPGLAAAEAEARSAKRGVWSRPQPTPPWIYRGAGVCWEQQKAPAKSPRVPDVPETWDAASPPERARSRVIACQSSAVSPPVERARRRRSL